MKVFLVGPKWLGYTTDYCEKALTGNGEETHKFYYSDDLKFSIKDKIERRLLSYFPAINENRNKKSVMEMNERLVKEVICKRPDLLLILKGETIHKESLAKIKDKVKVKIASWWVDDPFRYRNIIDSAGLFDYYFIFDTYHIKKLGEAGMKNVHYLPCSCDGDVFKGEELDEEETGFYGSDVSFAGDMNPRREEVLSGLNGFNLKVWGMTWKKSKLKKCLATKRIIQQEELGKIYNSTKINININHPQSFYGTNIRTFEIASCGAFQLTDEKSDIKKLFKPNEEIVCYKDVNELRELIDYYLKHPDERKEIASRAQKRARKDHLYSNRMKELIEIINK